MFLKPRLVQERLPAIPARYQVMRLLFHIPYHRQGACYYSYLIEKCQSIKPLYWCKISSSVKASGQLKITRKEDNVVTIDFCDIEVGNELTRDLNTYYAADKVFKYYGFKNGKPW